MENQTIKRRHNLAIDSRSHGAITGVNEVLSYGDDELVLSTSEGTLTIRGKELKIVKFAAEDGSFSFSGTVALVRYDTKKPPLLKRIFK